MNKTHRAFIGSCVTAVAMMVGLLLPGTSAAASSYVQSTGHAVVVVNQVNGNIIYCVSLVPGGGGAPVGECRRIGTISTASLAGNVQISVAQSEAFITNLETGVMVQCSLVSSGGVPIGSCRAVQLP